MSNLTDERTLLKHMNDEKARVLIPAMLYCGILMLIGTTGNLMVVFFYGLKSKTTPATCFISSLAVFDLIACILGIPIEISDMVYYYMFESIAACRLLVFVNHFAVIGSAFTLSAIAVDRYKRICKPFEKQMSVKTSKIICCACIGLGVLLGWPSIALYTVEKVIINSSYEGIPVSVTGFDCTSIKDEAYTGYAWAFSAIQFIGFISITVVLIVSYFLVGRQLYKHKKFRFYVAQKNLRRTASGNMTTMTSQTEYSSEQGGASIPITSIPEEDEGELEEVEFDGPDEDPPPMMQETIPDLRELMELDVNDLPDVDNDRPHSALREFLESGPNSARLSRPSSILTDASGRSRRSIMTIRSVTICDVNDNQIYDIEPRDKNTSQNKKWRPRSARSDSTWSNSITRPGSICSIDAMSRTSSLTSVMNVFDEQDRENSGSTSNVNLTTKTHSIASNMSVDMRKSNLKRTQSDGCVETGSLRRQNFLNSTVKTSGLKRTISEGSGIRRSGSSGSVTSRGLRRTGSNESSKMNTDTDNLKDMRMKLLDINTVKYTVIMIIIALVFIFSCVPYLALAVWRVYSHDNLVYEFNDVQLVWFQIGIRSYFLNCAINPFIYGFFNSQFRDFFYNAWCKCCARARVAEVVEKEQSDSKGKSTPRSS